MTYPAMAGGIEFYENYMRKPDFHVGNRVTDGDCCGTVTKVFVSDDGLGHLTPCLSVRLPKGQGESFQCTRADWWRKP